MAYTTPRKVFASMQRIEAAEESFDNISSGDTVELANFYIIEDTEDLEIDGSTVADSDYSIDLEKNQVTYSGSSSGTLTVDYEFGPYDSATVNYRIEGVEEYIDDYTNSTYDGLAQVAGEVYDGGGRRQKVYVFHRRPVREVSDVSVNQNTSATSNPNYESLTEGLGEDYLDYQKLGVKFLDYGTMPDDSPEDLKVDYKYGYSDVPADLREAATEMVIDDLTRGTVSGAMVDGRDNFDPQTVDVQSKEWREVLDRYRIQRMENFTNLAQEGKAS